LWRWKRPAQRAAVAGERLWDGIRAGFLYTVHSPANRAILLRVFAFIVPAVVIWSQVPIIATGQLGIGRLPPAGGGSGAAPAAATSAAPTTSASTTAPATRATTATAPAAATAATAATKPTTVPAVASAPLDPAAAKAASDAAA